MSDQKLKDCLLKIRQLVDDCLDGQERIGASGVVSADTETEQGTNSGALYCSSIVDKINDCEETEKIEGQILPSRSGINRILLPLYICLKYFDGHRLTKYRYKGYTIATWDRDA